MEVLLAEEEQTRKQADQEVSLVDQVVAERQDMSRKAKEWRREAKRLERRVAELEGDLAKAQEEAQKRGDAMIAADKAIRGLQEQHASRTRALEGQVASLRHQVREGGEGGGGPTTWTATQRSHIARVPNDQPHTETNTSDIRTRTPCKGTHTRGSLRPPPRRCTSWRRPWSDPRGARRTSGAPSRRTARAGTRWRCESSASATSAASGSSRSRPSASRPRSRTAPTRPSSAGSRPACPPRRGAPGGATRGTSGARRRRPLRDGSRRRCIWRRCARRRRTRGPGRRPRGSARWSSRGRRSGRLGWPPSSPPTPGATVSCFLSRADDPVPLEARTHTHAHVHTHTHHARTPMLTCTHTRTPMLTRTCTITLITPAPPSQDRRR